MKTHAPSRNLFRFVAASFAVSVACLATAAPLSAAVIPNDLNSYSLFAIDSIEFQGGSNGFGNIFSGNVGVNNVTPIYKTFSLAFGTSAGTIMGDNTTVVADSVTDGNQHGGSYYDLFANTFSSNYASVTRNPPTHTFTGPIFASMPALPFTPGRAITSGASDLDIATGTTTFLSPATPYKNVVIHDDSVVTFSAGTYNMQNLQLGKNVTLNLDDGTIFQIDQKFDPNDDDLVGGNVGYNGGAWFYVGGNKPDNSGFLNASTTVTTNLAHSSEYHMHYYAPNSWLDLGGSQNSLFGTFWALRVTGDKEVNITWVPPGTGGGVPEPASLSLLALASAPLLLRRRR